LISHKVDILYIDHFGIVNRADIGNSRDMATESVYTVKKLIAMTPAMATAISEYRFDARIASEAEAVRRLIEFGLKAATKGKK
jgi:hypothetical protein